MLFHDEIAQATRKAEIRRDQVRVTVKHPGESGWGVKPPPVKGYKPSFVSRVGGSHTTWTYLPVSA